jgi:hypothetical protein
MPHHCPTVTIRYINIHRKREDQDNWDLNYVQEATTKELVVLNL